MKIRIIALLLSVAFLASCSSSRYGRIPKAKKQKHTVAKKQFRKKRVKQVEGIVAKKPSANTELENPQLTISELEIPQNNHKTNTKKEITRASVQNRNEQSTIKQILKPNKTQKVERETDNQEVANGSWLWYVIVGIVLMLIGAIIPVVGWVFYVVGVIAVIYGLLKLLGIF
jgi:thiol:disulfide interchange protein